MLKLIYLSFYCWVARVLDIFWIQIPYQIYGLQIFFFLCFRLFFPLLFFFYSILWSTNVWHFNEVQFNLFFSFVTCAFDVICRKSLPNWRSWKFGPMCSSKSFIVDVLTFGVEPKEFSRAFTQQQKVSLKEGFSLPPAKRRKAFSACFPVVTHCKVCSPCRNMLGRCRPGRGFGRQEQGARFPRSRLGLAFCESWIP